MRGRKPPSTGKDQAKQTATRRAAKRLGLKFGPHDELAMQHGCYLDVAAAERVRQFFERYLRHSKGQWAGQPFLLQDWQWRQVLLPIFAWRDPSGLRRYRRGYIEVPKKTERVPSFPGFPCIFS